MKAMLVKWKVNISVLVVLLLGFKEDAEKTRQKIIVNRQQCTTEGYITDIRVLGGKLDLILCCSH